MGFSLYNNTRGFTLLELVVSVGLLALVAASLIPFLTGSYEGVFSSGKKTQAVFLAQGKMEYLKSLSYESLVKDNGSFEGYEPGEGFEGYQINYSMEKAAIDAGGYTVNGLEIVVDVLYENNKKKVSLKNFIRQP